MANSAFTSVSLLLTVAIAWLPLPGNAQGRITCVAAGDFPDPVDCRIIHKCPYAGAQSSPIACPPGTIYDTVCKWPYQTNRVCNGSSEGMTSAGQPPNEMQTDSSYSETSHTVGDFKGRITCIAAGDFPDPVDCRIIHKCPYAGAQSFPIACPPGTIYDTVCKWPYQTNRVCNGSSQGTLATEGLLPSTSPSPTSALAKEATVTVESKASAATPTTTPRPNFTISMVCVIGQRCRSECERRGYSSGACDSWGLCRCI